MCGLIGFAGDAPEGTWRETCTIIGNMLIAASERGVDATGFAALLAPYKRPEDNRVLMGKAAQSAEEFVQQNTAFRSLRHHRASLFVGHARWATTGEPSDNRNNHPHVSREKSLYLAHNGMISGHGLIAQKHGLTLETECDSEILLRLIEAAADPMIGLIRCLQECGGSSSSMAVALLDEKQKCIWLARDAEKPLWIALLNDRRVFFASTKRILLAGLHSVWRNVYPRLVVLMPLAANSVYRLTPDGRLLATATTQNTG